MDYICCVIIGKLKYLIAFIIFLGYLQAVVEVNTDTIKNTWGDEYDTYVHAKNSESTNFKKNDFHVAFILLKDHTTIQVKLPSISLPVVYHFSVKSYPPKIFLENCSLLI